MTKSVNNFHSLKKHHKPAYSIGYCLCSVDRRCAYEHERRGVQKLADRRPFGQQHRWALLGAQSAAVVLPDLDQLRVSPSLAPPPSLISGSVASSTKLRTVHSLLFIRSHRGRPAVSRTVVEAPIRHSTTTCNYFRFPSSCFAGLHLRPLRNRRRRRSPRPRVRSIPQAPPSQQPAAFPRTLPPRARPPRVQRSYRV